MKKRIVSALLCLCVLLCMMSGAEAAVISGYTSKVDYDNTDANRYYIEIDLKNQIITVYDLYESSIVLQSLCTTGNEENPTGEGLYKIGNLKERFGYFVAYGQYAQYWTQVVRGIYIHSVMYDSLDLSSMSKDAYNKLGRNVSHGCVRVLPHVAQWIFYNCPPGTQCRVTSKIMEDPFLVERLKAQIPSYGDYKQPEDEKADPVEIPAVVKFEGAALRTGFSTSRDKTLSTLSLNDKLMLLQIASDWCKVRTIDGTLGYVKTQYLKFDPDAPLMFRNGYGAIKKTYIYESCSTDSERLLTLKTGAEVQVFDNPKSGWYSAECNGVKGYVRTKYVKEQALPVYPQLQSSSVLVNDGINSYVLEAAIAYIRSDAAANLRSEASSSSGVLTVLSPSTAVNVLSVQGNWYYCTTDEGYSGYLHITCFQ